MYHAEAYDIVTNSRVLWSVQRIKEYVYKIAC